VRARPGYFSNESVEILKEWLEGNLNHPYVKKSEVNALELKSGLSKKQIMGWCTNVRRVSIKFFDKFWFTVKTKLKTNLLYRED